MSSKILIVDDTAHVLDELKDILEMEGFYVDTAKTATNALLKLESGNFKLVISDFRMPGLSGLELLAIIKDDQKTKKLPVIILSANAEEENIKKAEELNAAAYLKKPCSAEQLLKAVKNTMS